MWLLPSSRLCAGTRPKVVLHGRGARYTRNRDVMVDGMRELGFETLLKDRWLSPIIVTFFCPADRRNLCSIEVLRADEGQRVS